MQETIEATTATETHTAADITATGGTPTLRLNRADLREGWAEKGLQPRIIAQIKMGAKTDLGRVRENNEDKFDFLEPEDIGVLASKGSLYAIADGMGGHSSGQIACELALKTLIRSYYSGETTDVGSCLRHAVSEANSLIFDTARMIPDRHGMGTTLTAAIVRNDRLTIAQVGDSRAYLIRNGQIQQITEDHSWVAEQVRLGSMTYDEAQGSPFRNIITRSIGTAATVEPDIAEHALNVGDLVVLCSDGLSGHLDSEDIRIIAEKYSPSVAAQYLIDLANERGGRDNITALVLSVRALNPNTPNEDSASDVSAPTTRKVEKRGWGLRR